MGKAFFDQFSLLHFSVGAVAYFWGIDLVQLLVTHTVFEVVENTDAGMSVINQIPMWPGGKHAKDSFINVVGDTIFAAAGWTAASKLDESNRKK